MRYHSAILQCLQFLDCGSSWRRRRLLLRHVLRLPVDNARLPEEVEQAVRRVDVVQVKKTGSDALVKLL